MRVMIFASPILGTTTDRRKRKGETMSEQTQISIDRLRAAWMTYRDMAHTWADDPDDNDGSDFDAFMKLRPVEGEGDFNCCVSTINSELIVASKARDE